MHLSAGLPAYSRLCTPAACCRFTGPLAGVAKSVVALDFMENLIDQNRASNAHFGNIDFRWGMQVLAKGESCAGGLGGVAGGCLEVAGGWRAGALAAALLFAGRAFCLHSASPFCSGHSL
jgi:hypothetical protein